MVRNPDLSLILPCFNEETIFIESVEKIISILHLTKFSFELIFVDDKSRDNTPKMIEMMCREYDFCRMILHKVNTGRGRTVVDGIMKSHGKVVGYIDIDLEVSPVYIPEIVAMILKDKADMVIGERVYRTSFASLHREILSKGYLYLVDKLLGTQGLDTESGYKFFNRKKIMPIIRKTTHPRWFWDTEVTALALRVGLNVQQIPVLFLRRFDKKSSVNLLRDIADYFISLWKFRRKIK